MDPCNKASKIRRYNCEKQIQNENKSIENSQSSPPLLSDQISSLEKRVKLLEKTLKEQNALIIDELAAIKVSVRMLCCNKKSTEKLAHIFPINSTDEMQKFEENISSMGEDIVTKCVQKIIGKAGLSKSLGNLLGPNVIHDYNYEGLQNKKALKDFKNIDKILFGAVKSDVITKQNYVKEIKAGFKRSKNLLYKQKYNNKISQPENV